MTARCAEAVRDGIEADGARVCVDLKSAVSGGGLACLARLVGLGSDLGDAPVTLALFFGHRLAVADVYGLGQRV